MDALKKVGGAIAVFACIAALVFACAGGGGVKAGVNGPPQNPFQLDASAGANLVVGDGGYIAPGLVPGLSQIMETTSSDAGAVNTSMTWAIPVGTIGRVTFNISGKQPSDGGHQLGGDSTWQCGVENNGATCQVYRACAAVNSWVATDGGNTWTTTVAVARPSGDAGTQCIATATVTGASTAGPIHWEATATYNAAK